MSGQVKRELVARGRAPERGLLPEALFNRLRYGAGVISWGGEIYNRGSGGYHTTTQMGSGHFPRDGYNTKSAFISDIGHIQETGRMRSTPAGDLSPLVTKLTATTW